MIRKMDVLHAAAAMLTIAQLGSGDTADAKEPPKQRGGPKVERVIQKTPQQVVAGAIETVLKRTPDIDTTSKEFGDQLALEFQKMEKPDSGGLFSLTPLSNSTAIAYRDFLLAVNELPSFKQSADLQAIVQNGALKDVQGKANAIRDLTQALPAHASSLSTDAQAKLQQDVTLVATLVEKLNAAGNAGNQVGAKASFVKLNNVLGGMTRFP